ncbi:hypothetical protein D9M72_471390 [compost metagenome]
MLAAVHPVLADSRTGVRSQVLEACGVGRRGSHDGGVFQCAVVLERLANSRDGGRLLADGHVDAAHLLGDISGSPVGLLVDDGVDGDCRLAGLAVTNDQLTLAAADRDHGVDSLQTGLHRFVNRLALGHAGRLEFQCTGGLSLDFAEVVDRLAQRVNHAAEEGVANRHGQNLTRAVDFLAFFDSGEVTEDDDTDFADVEVLGQAQRAVFETKQLVRHDRGKALNTGDAVTCGGHTADLYALCVSGFVGRRELVQRNTDVVGVDGQFGHLQSLLSCFRDHRCHDDRGFYQLSCACPVSRQADAGAGPGG